MSDYLTSLRRLYALLDRGRQPGLERMRAVCERLGHPERKFAAVHVAGTNGKGSVCAFLSAMAQASGMRVGMYTSPHLHRVTERIQLDNSPIEDEHMADVLDRVMDAGPDLTFFEVLTAAAYLAFAEARVDLAVVEVGLGGRLDATNVLPPPRVAVITRVAYDHMAELGDSLTAIAGEKAAIIKSGSAVVTGKLHPDASAVVQQRVLEVGARWVPLGSPEPSPGAPLAYPRVAMFGTNLAVAVTAARELGLSTEAISDGIESTRWPGRNELLHRNGQELTLLDCAHNPDAAVSLSHVADPSMIGEISKRDVALVFGAIAGKNWRGMLRRLESVAGHRILVAPPVPRAVPAAEMAALVGGEVAPDVGTGLAMAREIVGPRGLVLVTGSCFLVAAARALLLGVPTDPPANA